MREKIKRFLAAIVVVPIAVGFCSSLIANNVYADTIVVSDMMKAFPDANFRAYVLNNFDKNKDNKLSADEIAAVKSINVSNEGAKISDGAGVATAQLDGSKVVKIDNLIGIEYFTNLETLNVSYNKSLKKMNLSSNTKLTKIVAHNTGLNYLDISNLSELTDLRVWNTPLSSLYIGNNTKLTYLDISYSYISRINVGSVTALNQIMIYNPTPTIKQWKGKDYKEYKYSSATLITSNNVDILTTKSYGELKITPDVFGSEGFCAYLRDKVDNDFNGSLSDSEMDKVTIIVTINPYFMSYSSPTRLYDIGAIDGLDHFKNLNELIVGRSYVTSIDLTGCSNLEVLVCGDNSISSLDLSCCPKLKTLYCNYNRLISLDLTKCPELETIYCDVNNIDFLDFSKCTKLVTVDCSDNKKITSLDFSNCSKLSKLTASDCTLTSINLSGCEELLELRLYSNPDLSSVDLSTCSKLYHFNAYNINVSYLNIANNPCLIEAYNAGVIQIGDSADEIHDSYSLNDKKYNMYLPLNTTIDITKPQTPTPTPGATGGTTGGSTSGSSSSTPATPNLPVNDTAVAGFAERLYTKCLNRASDPSGKSYWISKLKEGKSGAAVAKEFFFSQEFTGFGLDDKEYVTRLYRTFMDREPDASGLNYWLNELANGRTREFVFYGFVNSQEWANICLTYGIVSGGNKTASITKQPTAAINDFTTRMYTTCLGRNAEPSGQAYWAGELANMRKTGTQVAYEFFFSSEFTNANHSDSEFVTRLYRTFMGREPDTDGFNYWLNQLANGASRKSVFDGFSTSQEFSNLCIEAGILR
ncbi:MAG: DUF4214 domain-containing protein [Clostridia bacterium]|nr:DUF4214 domain-containing protein [Clostridia bacterium]